MAPENRAIRWRSWFPLPTDDRGIDLGRWVLLEANRYAVTGALLTLTFVSIMAIGTLGTFPIRRLLTETRAVQTILNTLLSGSILLVSIVVSINSIVITYEIASVSRQEERIEGATEFHRELDWLAGTGESPTNPTAFLRLLVTRITERARALEEFSQDDDTEFAQNVQAHVEQIVDTVEHLEDAVRRAGGGEFAVLWLALETDYGPLMNRSRQLTSTHRDHLSEAAEDRFTELLRSLEVFATGREYFKTLYYNREIAALSRTLLLVSLPVIVVTATTILAVSAGLFPEVWAFGLPPLLPFIAVAFTVALTPYIVLTAFMLRVATVALRTASGGPFVLK